MKHLLSMAALLMTTAFMTSCSDDDDAIVNQEAKVMVVHASPNAPNVDVRINNTVALTNVAYLSNSAYTTVPSGSTNIKVSATGTTTYPIDATVNLDANKNYSVFAIDSLSKIKAAVVMDDLTAPAAGKAHVRFFHFSPNAPAVDIAIAGGATVFANRSFNDQAANASKAAFTAVDAGTLNLQVKTAGTSTVVLSLPAITLTAGKIYTIYAKGFLTGTGAQALGAQVITHN